MYYLDLRSVLKSKYIQGLEIYEAHKSLNKSKVSNYVEKAKQAISSAGGGPLVLSLPAHPELLAKYYDLRALMKVADLMTVQTHSLGLVKKMTYHPSRLSGLWDMMNTDSVVDLVVGLGVPTSKLVISLPATARQFRLQNETLSTPGSPAEDEEPLEIDQAELCRHLSQGRWTLERDQDLAAPYAFKDKTWISFEDSSSVDVKGKYARVRGLAGLALHDADKDVDTSCGPSLRSTISKVLNAQRRAPRAAVLRSLEHEILSSSVHHGRALDALQVSPYRITQVVDSDGVIHSLREDTRTEFSCSRQGYFVHPRSCARFYRCVKFDQLSPDYTVFEFDCPAGLAFDSRYEVCVWPGSLQHSQACPGSSEIAPVPQSRFVCPEHEGYYADPENCRWFFACLDHGKAPLAAYEFRCPFGLGFDAARLQCDWPWLVPACGNIGRYEAEAHGFSGAVLTGAAGFYGKTADAVNVAAHQGLISGASLDNLVGIQGGFLSKADAYDGNYVVSQKNIENTGAFGYQNVHNANLGGINSGFTHQISHSGNEGRLNVGQISSDNGHYTSGSLILDEYREPSKTKVATASHSYVKTQQQGYADDNLSVLGLKHGSAATNQNLFLHKSANAASDGNLKLLQYQNVSPYKSSQADETGAYIHDPSGDYAEPYRHVDSPRVPYVHDDRVYKDYNDYGKYNEYSSAQHEINGQYVHDNSGQYIDNSKYVYESGDNGAYKEDYSGAYKEDYSGAYKEDYSGAYKENDSGAYKENYFGSYASTSADAFGGKAYQSSGNANSYLLYNQDYSSKSALGTIGKTLNQKYNAYSDGNSGQYVTDDKAYTGASHTLAAGAINVGLVGKTTLVDAEYFDQNNYRNSGAYSSASHSQTIHDDRSYHTSQPAYVPQSGVSISHAGTDININNVNGYSYVTTPTTSAIPTTATPIAVTTSIPVTTYKTTYVSQQPRTHVKQVFGYSQPDVTFVQPTVVAVTTYPKPSFIQNQSQVHTYQQNKYDNDNYFKQSQKDRIESSGYEYPTPSVRFDDGIKTYTTVSHTTKEYVSPQIVKFEPRGFGHKTVHKVESIGYDYETSTPVYEEPIKKAFAYTTSTPVVATYVQPTVSTYVPQIHSINHQTIHRVTTNKVNQYSTSADSGFTGYEYNKPTVNFEEVPQRIRYTTAQPAIVQAQGSISSKPEIYSHQTIHKVETQKVYSSYTYITRNPKKNIEIDSGLSYSQPSVISHQINHQSSTRAKSRIENENAVFVSTTPANIVHEEHYSEYETPKQQVTYKAAEYLPPKSDYVAPTVFSTSAPIAAVKQDSVLRDQNQYNYESVNYLQKSDVPLQKVQPVQVSFSTQHISQPKIYSTRPVTSTYKPIVYESPEIQVGYNTEEYLPPAVSVVKSITPTVKTQTYSPIIVSSTSREYLPPTLVSTPSDYSLPKAVTYSTPLTVRPIVKSTTPTPTFRYETSSTPSFKAPEYLPPVDKTITDSNVVNFESFGFKNSDAELSKLQYNPFTVQQSVSSPEYSTTAPVQRKQNIVVQNAKSNLLGFGTVGPDAGIVSEFSHSTLSPSVSPDIQNYVNSVTSTIRPIKQEFVEVTPSPLPIKRTKSKVAVVTKVNDFNPFLVRKLGAVCSCQPQSQVLVLKGRKPTPQFNQDYDNYSNDYDESNSDVIDEYKEQPKTERIQAANLPSSRTVTVTPILKSTFNPIIVPDDSHYQDYSELKGREIYSESYVSSTPVSTYAPSNENLVRIRPRVKAVTVAPTYKTVLLNQEVTPTSLIHESQETLAFDRYGPGGWRSRDETLQGTVDCQRAGLFRHPKQCNKFYACRWDCTKQRFTLHVFNCPVQLSFDPKLGACNWPSQGPACQGDTLFTNTL
ncbi:Probable chitinase 10 [Eumeta japonica]|uniref:Probable chitinase 10 n=1 Tax=Eumeta variegata TaxID=151549 RepID=A0A4C1Y159_EUMVA|nr:Probable chitinase 10 [Eumeta japonica]